MPTTTVQKLKIKEGYSLLTIHAPETFKTDIGDLPAGVTVSGKAKTFHQVHWFVKDLAQLQEEKNDVLALLQNDITCWIYFPKGSSGVQTDLTRDSLWQQFAANDNLQWLTLVSFNNTWSAFSLRLKTAGKPSTKKAAADRPIQPYIDPVKRVVYLPDDFSAALSGAPEGKAFFDALSFTNKKEYVEWIVSAKREETRKTRVQESVSRLARRWKNPSNR